MYKKSFVRTARVSSAYFCNLPQNSMYNLFDQIKMCFGGINESVKLSFSSIMKIIVLSL